MDGVSEHREERYATEEEVEAARRTLSGARALVLMLDYDGTLVPLAEAPQLAVPDGALLELLARLVARPATEVHIVSGRSAEGLDGFFGALGVHLHAEHGQYSRQPGGAWSAVDTVPKPWRAKATEILQDFAARTPGAFVEEKRGGVAWHYRMADVEAGPRTAKELAEHLSAVAWGEPVEVLLGNKVVELRPRGVNKGLVAARVAARCGPDTLIAAFGDDCTDEDLFAALPAEALTVHVGPSPSRARVRLRSTLEVRGLLSSLVA